MTSRMELLTKRSDILGQSCNKSRRVNAIAAFVILLFSANSHFVYLPLNLNRYNAAKII